MKTMQEWLDAYGESHQNPTNKLIHWICVPVIFISIVGLLASIPAEFLQNIFPEKIKPYVNWASTGLVMALVFYFRLSKTMFIAILLWSVFCLWLVQQMYFLPLPVWASCSILFFLAWVGQFYGHHIEGAKPSFINDLKFLLIGPAWLIAHLLKKANINY